MIESVMALIIATSVLLGSPGPAPLALAATSATFGVKNSLPFYFGILLGLCVVIAGAILGLSILLSSYPEIKFIVQMIGSIYLIYIAYKIGSAPVVKQDDSLTANHPSVLDGFILNILNPKAYAAFFAIFSQFLIPTSSQVTSYLLTAIVSFTLAVIIDFIWVLLGGILKQTFQNARAARIIRVSFAIIMILVVGLGLFL